MTQQPTAVAASIRSVSDLATREPDRVAVRAKRRGIWQETSWRELDDEVGVLATGFASLGIGPGEIVALMAENSREWLLAYLGIQRLGAVLLAVPARATAAEVAARATPRGVRYFVCGDQEHVDAVIEAGVEPLAAAVVVDPVGLERYERSWLHTFADTVQAGRAQPLVEAVERTVSTVEYTRGDLTDVPATAMEGCAERAATVLHVTPRDRVFIASPLDDPVTRSIDLAAAIRGGATIHFPETAASVAVDMVEVSPTILCGPRRVFELLEIEARTLQHQTGRVRQTLIEWAYRGPVGRRSSIRQWLVLRHIAARHGLEHVRRAVVIGERLSTTTRAFLQSLDIDVVHVWGSPHQGGLVFAEGADVAPDAALSADDVAEANAWRSQFADEGTGSTLALEAELREHEIIRRVFIAPTSHGRTAFFELDFAAAGVWASRTQVEAVSPARLAESDSTTAVVASELARVGGTAAVDAYVILPRAADAVEGEAGLLREQTRSQVAAEFEHLARPVAVPEPSSREVVS